MDDLEDYLKLTGRDAILYIAENYSTKSMYAIAKQLSNDEVKVHAIQITNYLKRGTKMSRKVADRVFAEYNIIVTDVYEPSAVRRNYNSGI